ncbi:MAG: fumarylacetoacetate hydrolase family protein, partial [Steroidobacteraceae bacterium]
MSTALRRIPMEVAPFRLSGTVYGALLNHRTALAALGGRMTLPPYNAPPRAPVLYLKPRNTLALDGDIVEVPAAAAAAAAGASAGATAELEAAACLGLVIGRTACNVSAAHALDHVAGFLIVNDVSIPHPDYYRPSVRYKARDGFCPLGPRVTARAVIANPDALVIRTYVDGVLVQTMSTADLIRSAARLIADVTEFMTLAPGDVLAAGAAA